MGCCYLQTFFHCFISYPLFFRKSSNRAMFSLITIKLSTFLGASRFLLAVTMLPPVLKTRSDLADEAGMQRILFAREASKGRTALCCFHQCRMLTFVMYCTVLYFTSFHCSAMQCTSLYCTTSDVCTRGVTLRTSMRQ